MQQSCEEQEAIQNARLGDRVDFSIFLWVMAKQIVGWQYFVIAASYSQHKSPSLGATESMLAMIPHDFARYFPHGRQEVVSGEWNSNCLEHTWRALCAR